MFQDNKNLLESFCHAVLIFEKKLKIATRTADKSTHDLLEKCGSFHSIVKEFYGLFPENVLSDPKYDKIRKKLLTLPPSFKTITINDNEYPKQLRLLNYASPVLYTIGDTSLFNTKSIGVVGTRRLENQLDITAGNMCLRRLLNKGYTIVSGLALGCDSLGHRYAVEHDGRTIAVLGNTIDRYYPKENKELQDRIAKEHLLVSQYPVGISTFGSYFAHRNTTTVGLSSEGLVIILSPDKSGTVHAIRECVESGKQLYILSHNLDHGYEWPEKYRGKYKVVG